MVGVGRIFENARPMSMTGLKGWVYSAMAAIVLLAGASDAGARPAATAQRRPAAQDGDELVWLLNRHAHGQWELFYAYPDDHYRNITFRCGPHEGRVHARLTIDEGEGLDHPIGARLRTGFSLIGFAEHAGQRPARV